MADDRDRLISEQKQRIEELEAQIRELAQQLAKHAGSEARFPKRMW